MAEKALDLTVKKFVFHTLRNLPETRPVPTGTMYDKTYNLAIDKETGKKVLSCNGETNRYAKVQSHLEECLIENILAKATLDPSVLNKTSGLYFDATSMPKTLSEAQNAIIQITQEFEKLDTDTKSKFDNSVEKYVDQYGTLPWAEALGRIKKEVAEKTADETEVKEESNNAE